VGIFLYTLIHPYRKIGGRGPRLSNPRKGCLAFRGVIRIGLGEATAGGPQVGVYNVYRAVRS